MAGAAFLMQHMAERRRAGLGGSAAGALARLKPNTASARQFITPESVSTRVLTSASGTLALAGIGMGPYTPLLPC